MHKNGLNHKFALESNAPVTMTAADAVSWLQHQPRFEMGNNNKGRIHDFVGHILANATSGIIADERRAAISEFYILGLPTLNPYSGFKDDRIVTGEKPAPSDVRLLANFYATTSTEENMNIIQEQKDLIQRRVTGSHKKYPLDLLPSAQAEEIQKLIENDPLIADAIERSRKATLSDYEFEETSLRAKALDLFFRNNHMGFGVRDCKVSEILAMPLNEFGIKAHECEGRLEFIPLIEIPRPQMAAGINQAISGQGFSL